MSISKYAFGAGLLTGAVLALITLGDKIPSISGIVWALRLIALVGMTMYFIQSYRNKYGQGYISGNTVFSMTFQMFLYIGIIAAGYNFLSITLMPSDDFQMALNITQQSYADAGVDISNVNFDKIIELIPYFSAFFMFLGHLITGLIFGGLYTLIFRREKPIEFE